MISASLWTNTGRRWLLPGRRRWSDMGTCCLDSSNPVGRGKNSCWNLQQPWSMSSHARGLYIHPGSFLNGDFPDSSHTLCKIRLYMYTFYLSALMIRCLAKLTFQQVSIDLVLRIWLRQIYMYLIFLRMNLKQCIWFSGSCLELTKDVLKE